MLFQNLNFIAAALAMMIYITIAIKMLRGNMMGLNLATYALWCILDLIAAASLYSKGGEWVLPAAYAAGCVIVMVPLIISRSFSWTKLDTTITVMVFASVGVWVYLGPTAATIVSTMSVVIACIPQAWDVYRKPEHAVIWIYAGYTITNGLSALGAKEWSVGEMFYPGCCTIATIVILLLSLRKLSLKKIA